MAEEPLIGESYRGIFDTLGYLKNYVYHGEIQEWRVHNLKLLQEFYESCSQSHPKFSLLDYGAGPVIANVICAAPYASEIVLAEYVESNRLALQQWLEKDPKAFDWCHYFRHLNGAEAGKEVIQAKEDELRMRVKRVVSCDITNDPPIQSGCEGPYDVVVSCLCLETACATLSEYTAAVRRVATLLKPGGRIFLVSVEKEGAPEGEKCYYVDGKNKLFTWILSESIVWNALEQAGCGDIVVERGPAISKLHSATIFFTAVKRS